MGMETNKSDSMAKPITVRSCVALGTHLASIFLFSHRTVVKTGLDHTVDIFSRGC